MARSEIDISQSIEDARRASEKHAETDPTYAELMATYVELGELLDCGRTGPEFELECRDLVGTLIALDRVLDAEFAERWAVWCAQSMRSAAGWAQ